MNLFVPLLRKKFYYKLTTPHIKINNILINLFWPRVNNSSFAIQNIYINWYFLQLSINVQLNNLKYYTFYFSKILYLVNIYGKCMAGQISQKSVINNHSHIFYIKYIKEIKVNNNTKVYIAYYWQHFS